jgi:hypothetical protein
MADLTTTNGGAVIDVQCGTWVRLPSGEVAEVTGQRELWNGEYVELRCELTFGGWPVPGLQAGAGLARKRRSRSMTLERAANLRPVAGTSGPTAAYLAACELLCPGGVPVREWPDTGPRPGQQLTFEHEERGRW